LISVDFPALGAPAIATKPHREVIYNGGGYPADLPY